MERPLLPDIDVLGVQIEEVKHNFKPAIAEQVNYNGVEIDCEGACSGCSNSVYIALERLNAAGDLEKIKGLQIKCGTGKPNFASYKNCFFLGKCSNAMFNKESAANDIHFVEGCAPAALTLEEAIRSVCDVPRH